MKNDNMLRPCLSPHPRLSQIVEADDPFEQSLRYGARLMLYFLLGMVLSFLVFALFGCASPVHLANAGSAASSGLAANLDTAHGEVDLAEPHADAIGRAHLVSADNAISSGKSKLPAINAGLAQVAPLSAKVDKLQHQFWSPRQRAMGLWIGIGTLIVVLVALYFGTSIAAPVGVIALKLWHVLTLGVPKLVHWIVAKAQTNVQRVRARTSSQSPPPMAKPDMGMVATASGMKPA